MRGTDDRRRARTSKRTRAMRLSRPSAILILLLLPIACSTRGFHPPDRDADIDGIVTDWATGQRAGMLVEENPDETYGSRKIHFGVTPETQLLRWNDDAGGYGTIERSDIREGDRVRAWSRGPIAESYPEQATAHTIVLLNER